MTDDISVCTSEDPLTPLSLFPQIISSTRTRGVTSASGNSKMNSNRPEIWPVSFNFWLFYILTSHPNMMNVFQLSRNYLYSPQKNKSTALIYFGHSSPQVSTVQENSFSPIQLFRFEKLEKLHRLINHRLGHNTTTTTHPAEWWPDHPCPFMFAEQIASGTSFLTRMASGICSKLLLLFRNFDSDHIYLAAGRRSVSHISRIFAAACQYLQLS